VTAMIITTV